MNTACIWLLFLDDAEPLGQSIARSLQPYGLPVKGCLWPKNEPMGWLHCAQEAAQAQASVVLVIASQASCQNPDTRRQLALFRLALHTLRKRWINGFILGADSNPIRNNISEPSLSGTGILDDWTALEGSGWPAKVVARAYAPKLAQWPVRLALHANERIGIWLETHPDPYQIAHGALVGVSGQDTSITFHAVGPKDALPERSVNEFELQGLTFEIGTHSFHAWALQNEIPVDHSYFVRLDKEPSVLAIGSLPNGNPDDVTLMHLR